VCACALLLAAAFAQAQPDLVITDVWRSGNVVHYQIMNLGDKTAAAGHDTKLMVGGFYATTDYNLPELEAGKRLNRFFDKYSWNCAQGQMEVCVEADGGDDVSEANETNNKRAETWKCEETAPKITEEPTVVVGIKTSVISWKTDEICSGSVLYDAKAGTFGQSRSHTGTGLNHSVTLESLSARTTYEYKVVSRDASGNEVSSRPHYFTTQPGEDSTKPKVQLFAPMLGQALPLHFQAQATDDESVDRVQFTLDGMCVMTDYDPPYECFLDPAFLGMSHQAWYGAMHDFTADAFDLANNRVQATFGIEDIPTCREIYLSVSLRGGFFETTAASIESQNIDLRIEAREQRLLDFHPRPRVPGETPPPGNDPWGSVQEVRVYFDDVLQDTLYPDDGGDDWYSYTLRTGEMEAPSDHTLRVEAVGTDGCIERQDCWIGVRRLSAYVFIKRRISRYGNLLHVATEIENTGPLAVYFDRYVEKTMGFYPIVRESPDDTGTSRYDPDKRQGMLEFDWNYALAPDETLKFYYYAVPILLEGFDEYDYDFGKEVELVYHDAYGRDYVKDTVGHVNEFEDSLRGIAPAVCDAIAESDYLIVTNPHNLLGIYDPEDVQSLLTAMAELAMERNGVLGYFDGQGMIHNTGFDRNDRVACGHVIGDRKEEIVVMDEEADAIKVYNAAHEQTIRVRLSRDVLETRLPIAFEGLASADVLLVGNLLHQEDGREPLDEIAILKGEGDRRGELKVFRYDPAADDFTVYTGSIRYNPALGEQAIVADMIVTAPNMSEEIAVFRADGRVEVYHGEGGAPQDGFNTVYEPGDLVAGGNLLPDEGDEIVVGDFSEDEILIYHGDSGRLLVTFPYDLTSFMQLLVCEEGLVIADAQADRVEVYEVDGGGATRIGGFDCLIGRDDDVVCGRIMDRVNPQFVFARGQDSDHYSARDIEIFTYSAYNGPETPGDRFDLLELLQPGGEWASRMRADWTANGYLLLVGEIEILPAFSCSYFLTGHGTRSVDFTDNHYANTAGSIKKPEIAVGRIIGNDAATMAEIVRRCVSIARGEQVLDTTSAYAVSGGPENRFDRERDNRADQLRDRGYNTVSEDDEIGMEVFFGRCANRDLIYLAGHGNTTVWDGKKSNDLALYFDSGTGAPLVYMNSCLTGRYPASTRGLAEIWLKYGASGCVAATEISYGPWSSYLAEGFIGRYGIDCPAGLALKNAKRNRMGEKGYGKYESAIYHFFGDPKMAPTPDVAAALETPAKSGSKGMEVSGPVDRVAVKIPMFEVTWDGSVASVRIEGGTVFAEPDRPEVPAYPIMIKWPEGYRIQDVRLTEKGGIVTGTGLPLSTVEPVIDGTPPKAGQPLPGAWPDRDLDWSVEPMPDGSSVLQIHVYPFCYTPETTNYEFFGACQLEIDYTMSGVEINRLVTDRKAYSQGDTVSIDMYVLVEGQDKDLDIIAEAQVTGWGSGLTEGLQIKRLGDLHGMGSCSWKWNSQGSAAGPYEVRVNLRQSNGTLLDTACHSFTVGTSAGMVQSLSVSPACFENKDSVVMSAVFANTGQTSLSGKIVIEAQDGETGNSLARFEDDFVNLPPDGTYAFEPSWTAIRSRGNCRFVAYAMFDGRSTPRVEWPHVSEFSNGDFNRDGQIGLQDFAAMADCWGAAESPADIAPARGDCRVDWADLVVVARAWLERLE
jgi:hypothetical protein